MIPGMGDKGSDRFNRQPLSPVVFPHPPAELEVAIVKPLHTRQTNDFAIGPGFQCSETNAVGIQMGRDPCGQFIDSIIRPGLTSDETHHVRIACHALKSCAIARPPGTNMQAFGFKTEGHDDVSGLGEGCSIAPGWGLGKLGRSLIHSRNCLFQPTQAKAGAPQHAQLFATFFVDSTVS